MSAKPKSRPSPQQKEEDRGKKAIPQAMSLGDMSKLVAETYGSSALMTKCSFQTSRRAGVVPSGVFELDMALGGGIPRGRSVMLWGGPSSGKSTLCMKIISQFQRYCRVCGQPFKKVEWKTTGEEWVNPDTGEVSDGPQLHRSDCGCPDGIGVPMKCAYIDIERSFDPAWAAVWGVYLDELFLLEPEYAEQAMDLGSMALATGDCDLLVLDSIAQMVPSEELAVTAEKWQMGLQPRLMGKTMRVWGARQHSFGVVNKPTILTTNQVRHSIGPYAGGLTMPGGKQTEHSQSVIISTKSIGEVVNEAGFVVGQETEFLVKKNKISPKGRTGSFVFYVMDDPGADQQFHAGDVNNVAQIVKLAVTWGLIEKTGGWYVIPGVEKKVNGIEAVVRKLEETPALLDTIRNSVVAAERRCLAGSSLLPPELRLEEDTEDVGGPDEF